MNLHDIGLKHGTDKASANHTYKGLSYLQRYEPYFQTKRYEKNNILELGVLGGNSMRTWLEYFPESNVIGIDIDPARKHVFNTVPRTEVIIGSQTDKNVRNEVLQKYKTLDIVLDDASHVNEMSIKSFNLYWPLLRDGGVYIIEDVAYSDNLDLGRTTWPGQNFNEEKTLDSTKKAMEDFILEKNIEMQNNVNNIHSIVLNHQFILLIKKFG
jgi:predicted O-methyltransferase YrrM